MNNELKMLRQRKAQLLQRKKDEAEIKKLKKEIREIENENSLLGKTIKFVKAVDKEIEKHVKDNK